MGYSGDGLSASFTHAAHTKKGVIQHQGILTPRGLADPQVLTCVGKLEINQKQTRTKTKKNKCSFKKTERCEEL